MGEKRTWDESRSPQWRYLLSKDSKERRNAEKRREKAERELSRSGEERKKTQEGDQKNRKLKSKSGREIVYSASPGGKNSSYRNEEFTASHKNNNKSKKQLLFDITNIDNDEP